MNFRGYIFNDKIDEQVVCFLSSKVLINHENCGIILILRLYLLNHNVFCGTNCLCPKFVKSFEWPEFRFPGPTKLMPMSTKEFLFRTSRKLSSKYSKLRWLFSYKRQFLLAHLPNKSRHFHLKRISNTTFSQGLIISR